MASTLPAALVIGGLLPGWTVQLTPELEDRIDLDGEPVLCVRPDNRGSLGDGWVVVGNHADEGLCFEWAPLSALLLVLPGPLGCNAHGLFRRTRERIGMARTGLAPWAHEAAGAAAFDDVGPQWLSRYLVMTDALAASRGWPTGPGAPVYGWRKYANSWAIFGAVEGSDRLYSDGSWACDADPMAALEAASGAL